MLSTKVTSARSTKTKTTLTIENDKGTAEIDADRVLVAVGRAPVRMVSGYPMPGSSRMKRDGHRGANFATNARDPGDR